MKYASAVGITKGYKKIGKYLCRKFTVKKRNSQSQKDDGEMFAQTNKLIKQYQAGKIYKVNIKITKGKIISPNKKNIKTYYKASELFL